MNNHLLCCESIVELLYRSHEAFGQENPGRVNPTANRRAWKQIYKESIKFLLPRDIVYIVGHFILFSSFFHAKYWKTGNGPRGWSRLLFHRTRLSSLEDLEADLVEVMVFAVSEVCPLEVGGVPLLLTSELVDCWLSLRGRINPREYSKTRDMMSSVDGGLHIHSCNKLVLKSLGEYSNKGTCVMISLAWEDIATNSKRYMLPRAMSYVWYVYVCVWWCTFFQQSYVLCYLVLDHLWSQSVNQPLQLQGIRRALLGCNHHL